jgi:putative transposase
VVGRFKSLTTRRYIDGVRFSHWHPFTDRLWQRNYYEHIIRDEMDYQSIFDYITCNPENWERDQEYPTH